MYTSTMILQGTESEEFNVTAVGIRSESTRGMKLSPTTDTFSGKGNATGATGIITESQLSRVMAHVETNLIHQQQVQVHQRHHAD